MVTLELIYTRLSEPFRSSKKKTKISNVTNPKVTHFATETARVLH